LGGGHYREFEYIFSFENLFKSWQEFSLGKKRKTDVAEFSLILISNLWKLHNDIMDGSYRHGGYVHFKINDPKPRDIHKASVRDRIVHHAIYRELYPYFDNKFIFSSYACRNDKGHHLALKHFASLIRAESNNGRKTVWVLKCDIKKFFASINKIILRRILYNHIENHNTRRVIHEVLESFEPGLPLGNLTSQLFGNVYLNELDQYMTNMLRIRFYMRYADDFIVLSRDKAWLEELLPKIGDFLEEQLKLELHQDKIFIKTIYSGVDFLGWVHFPEHRVLRSKTKRKMFNNLERKFSPAALSSYLGLLSHGNAWSLAEKIKSDTMRF